VDLVVCSHEPWDETWRRNQFFVRELLAQRPGLRILFVEPAADLVLARATRATRGLRRDPRFDRLTILRPGKVVPRVLGPWADYGMRRQVRAAARRLGLTRPVLWINNYAGCLLVEGAARGGWPTLYDITDDWLDAEAPARQLRRWRRQEAALLARAREVVVCSPALAERRGAVRPVELIENGVDVDLFRRPRPAPADLPPGPRALYVGTLHEHRLDVDLCRRLARERPDLQLVFVGPVALSASVRAALEAAPNVHLLGPRPYAEVPAYLQHADVLVVPHLASPFTESLDPIKAYECLAVGRPTVATPVAGFRTLGPPVRCAPPEEFVAAVAQALAGPDPGPPVAVVPTWAERAAAFGRVLDRVAAARGGSASVGRPGTTEDSSSAGDVAAGDRGADEH
jgi:glycosyltransferase involved in cell wall biosynthesis